MARYTLNSSSIHDNKPWHVQSMSLDVSTENSVDDPSKVISLKADLPVGFPYRFNSSCNNHLTYKLLQIKMCACLPATGSFLSNSSVTSRPKIENALHQKK